MSRLYSDQLQATGRRFYFALDSAPGIISPAPAVLTLQGLQPAAAQPTTIFRTPAPATLTLTGLSTAAPVVLTPAQAILTAAGQIPIEVRSLTITPALAAPQETSPSDFAPTLITIWTTQPGVAQVTLQTLEISVTQGGNIGFVSPGAAQVTLGTLGYTLLFGSEIGAGLLNVVGLVPTLSHGLTIHPDVGLVTVGELAPRLALPFTWVDDDPAPTSAWITDVAA